VLIFAENARSPPVIEDFAHGFDHGPGYFCHPAATLTKLGRLIALCPLPPQTEHRALRRMASVEASAPKTAIAAASFTGDRWPQVAPPPRQFPAAKLR
jgi:hypothetical protein